MEYGVEYSYRTFDHRLWLVAWRVSKTRTGRKDMGYFVGYPSGRVWD